MGENTFPLGSLTPKWKGTSWATQPQSTLSGRQEGVAREKPRGLELQETWREIRNKGGPFSFLLVLV